MSWPKILRDPSAIASIRGPLIAFDAEWNVRSGEPTIAGLSDGRTTVSTSWDDAFPYLQALVEREPSAMWVGHNFLAADMGVLAGKGLIIPPERVEDTIIYHWLTSMNLCKTTKKDSAGDDEGTKRGRGFLNIWSMSSLYTDLACWKKCRGAYCVGPCPEHDVFGYNGTDAYAPLIALPKMKRLAALRGCAGLYPLHRDLLVVLSNIERRGLRVDTKYVEKLRKDFADSKLEYWNAETKSGMMPFNPESPKQVKEYFKTRGIALDDTQESTVRETVEDHADVQELGWLLDWKELGDGPDRWFAPKEWDSKKRRWEGYVDEDGLVHPSLGIYTSSGRLNCTNPNFQNVAKRRIDRKTGEKVGKKIRRAIVPREGYYFLQCDYSNAENRVMAWYGGYDIPHTVDLHGWVRDELSIQDTDDFALSLGGARDAAKSISHANHYLEGLQLVDPVKLRSPRMQQEIRVGARIVFPDWKFQGKIVTFTGANFAERAWGSKTFENRKRALSFAQMYFKRFPGIRDAQRRITAQAERGFVQPLFKYYTASYGYADERCKTAAAIWGSQVVAHFTKLALLRAAQHPRLHTCLQVHDSLLFEIDRAYAPKDATKWALEVTHIETPEMPGLVLPADVEYSLTNWADMKTIYKQGAFVL